MDTRLRIAVIGSGIAGLTTAHVLGPHHDVVVFEAAERLGGHANTVDVVDPAAGRLSVDTGFIVHNDRNYPNLVKLFSTLGVAVKDASMSFAVTDRASGTAPFTYRATNLATLAADPRNIADPRMWRMLRDILRFYRDGRRFLQDPDPGQTIDEFVTQMGYGSEFRDLHLIPMGSAVWSMNPWDFGNFPALSLLEFLDNHGLLGLGDRPQWRTVVGGSRRYVEAIVKRFEGEIRAGAPVTSVIRDGISPSGGTTVVSGGVADRFDRVVLACHSDQALDLLPDATPDEKSILGAINYQSNRAVLHTDTTLLSPVRRAWAAWNYDTRGASEQRATVTYDLTTLQRLPGSHRYLVTLNGEDLIDPSSVIAEFAYAHPVFDHQAIVAQSRFEEIDGVLGTHFCGAWWGYGFHEDGVTSALRVCERLGVGW